MHHSQSDHPHDPFSPSGKTFLEKLQVGLYYHTGLRIRINFRHWRDKPTHRWFHKHYFSVVSSTALIILIASGHNFAYFACIPVLYMLAVFFW